MPPSPPSGEGSISSIFCVMKISHHHKPQGNTPLDGPLRRRPQTLRSDLSLQIVQERSMGGGDSSQVYHA